MVYVVTRDFELYKKNKVFIVEADCARSACELVAIHLNKLYGEQLRLEGCSLYKASEFSADYYGGGLKQVI